MLKFKVYIVCILQYLLGLVVLGGIITYFFPIAGMLVFVIGILGTYAAIKEDVEKRYQEELEKLEQKRILKVAEESKDEFDGFEQAITLTRRNMQ